MGCCLLKPRTMCILYKRLWFGFGYQRGVLPAEIAAAIQQLCEAHGLDAALIIGLATLETKATAGICELCAERHWQLRGFSAEQLRAVSVPHPAAVVMAKVATPSVAEAAAVLAAQSPLWIPKQMIRHPGQPSITLAVAQLLLEA